VKEFESGNLDVRVKIKSHDEIETLIKSFNKMSETIQSRTDQLNEARVVAEKASKAKGDFVGHMSHELRTPLNAIIGYSELLSEELREVPEASDLVDDTCKIVSSGKHLLSLINDILDLEKIEANRLELDIQHISVDEIIDRVMSTSAPLASKNGNNLLIDTECEGLFIETDSLRLSQVLLNLMSNACKFTYEGTITLRIRASVQEGEEFIHIAVVDTGIGMNEQQMEKVFQEFVQADASTTREFGGTGLGLSISQKLVRAMGGEISLESAPDVGSTFTVALPQKRGCASITVPMDY
jgi:signal transduction histidine kinase